MSDETADKAFDKAIEFASRAREEANGAVVWMARAKDLRIAELRALADHLEQRQCAPSLDGYNLVDGLHAAADLLDGESGPRVHADEAATTSSAKHVALAALLKSITRRESAR